MRIFLILSFLFVGLSLSACDSNDPSNNQGSGLTQTDIDALAAALGCTNVVSIVVGQSRNGNLTNGDCVNPNPGDNSRIDYYGFRLMSNTTITIDMESDDFDSYLYVYNASGGEIDFDDDSGGALDARISITLNAGLYAIGANGLTVSDLGSYRLELSD